MSSPERLAYWYLRLNGYLTTENFVIHPDSGSDQRTDADLLGVRFQNRSELLENPMEDDSCITDCSRLCDVVIAEVKTSECQLNGPWTNPNAQNMLRVVRAIGCLPSDENGAAAKALHDAAKYQNDRVQIRLVAFGETKSQHLKPEAQQILWPSVLRWVHSRFREYRRQKRSVGQWADDGRFLSRACMKPVEEFERSARMYFGVWGSE